MRRQATLGVSPTIKQRMKKSRSLPGGSRRIVKSNVIKIVTHNTNGLDEGSEHDTKTLISRQKPDLVGIIETKLRQEDGRRELEVKINKQCQRSMSKREIEEVMRKTMPKEDPYFEARLAVRAPSSLPRTVVVSGIRVRQQEVSVVRGSAMVQEAASPDSFNVANR